MRYRPAKHASIHRSLLSGLLGNIGQKGDTHEYNGAHGTKFSLFPGSTLFKQKPAWVMSAELVETTKLYARTLAGIRPEWVESLADHLVRREYFEPHWQGKTATCCRVRKSHVVWPGARRKTARALRADRPGRFASHLHRERAGGDGFQNRRALHAAQPRSDRVGRSAGSQGTQARYPGGSGSDRGVFRKALPADIYNGPLLDQWRRTAERERSDILFLRRSDVLKREPTDITPQLYPDVIEVNGFELPLEYRFDTASHADGVTAIVPLAALNQLSASRFEWLVPGMLSAKLLELIRSLPKSIRTQFIPNADYAQDAAQSLGSAKGPLVEALASYLGKRIGATIPAHARLIPSRFRRICT